MGPAANDVDRLDTMDDVDADSDVDTYDTVVIVSATEEDMDAARAQIEQNSRGDGRDDRRHQGSLEP